jgi:cyclopropane fatty-acyl-phospholipid synthase-like methyltransferase
MGTWDESEVASVWLKNAEGRNQMLRSATELMFELAGVGPGARVLDLGTGTGDTAIFAAARVGASGHVEATDFSTAMVDAARKATAAAGVKNVTVRQMSVESVDARGFDAAFARLVLMFVDAPRAIASVRAALAPGGRFATITWGPLGENAFNRALIESARAEGAKLDPPPEIVRAFSLSDGAALARTFAAAGFTDVQARQVSAIRHYASAAEAAHHARESPVYAPLFASLDEAAKARAWARIAADYARYERDGACDFPQLLNVVAGTAP